jgi:hypothetical protein
VATSLSGKIQSEGWYRDNIFTPLIRVYVRPAPPCAHWASEGQGDSPQFSHRQSTFLTSILSSSKHLSHLSPFIVRAIKVWISFITRIGLARSTINILFPRKSKSNSRRNQVLDYIDCYCQINHSTTKVNQGYLVEDFMVYMYCTAQLDSYNKTKSCPPGAYESSPSIKVPVGDWMQLQQDLMNSESDQKFKPSYALIKVHC